MSLHDHLDHSDLAALAARLFSMSVAGVSYCTTASIRQALAHKNSSYLQQRGW